MNNENNEPIFDELDNDGTDAPLTEDEIEMIKASRPELDRSTIREKKEEDPNVTAAKNYAKNNKFKVIFVSMTAILLVTILAVLGVMLYQTIKQNSLKGDFEVTIGDDDPITIEYETLMRDDVLYFDMRTIASYTKLLVSGSGDTLKFTAPDGTYVRFENGEETATINGTRVRLEGKAEIKAKTEKEIGSCFVPFTFIQKLFILENTSSVVVHRAEKENKITIYHKNYEAGENGKAPISFSENNFTIAENVQFDISASANPDFPEICGKSTLLVNKTHPLGEDYTPEGLVLLSGLGCPISWDKTTKLEKNAAAAATKMLKDLNIVLQQKGEKSVSVTSGFRSYDYQRKTFNDYVAQIKANHPELTHSQAVDKALETSAPAGYSEHQSGLCIDLIEKDVLDLDESFEGTYAFEWLSENAYKYGFILRYPKDKTEITGYNYEPWHYRFVGIDAATVIFEDKICLEEYLAVFD